MARSRISGREIDLQADNGAVLWSFIQGEQLAYNVTFDWIDNLHGMTIEAVAVESANTPGEYPTEVLVGGKQDKLTAYIPPYLGEWVSGQVYAKNDLVRVTPDDKYYQRRVAGGGVLPPSSDPSNWKDYGYNNVATLIFPDTLSVDYAVKPLPDKPIYCYFELAVTEAPGGMNRSWKPMRGLIEFLFSPTLLVP